VTKFSIFTSRKKKYVVIATYYQNTLKTGYLLRTQNVRLFRIMFSILFRNTINFKYQCN